MTDITTEHLVTFDLLIGGASEAAASGATYDSVDPFTRRPWAQCRLAEAAEQPE